MVYQLMSLQILLLTGVPHLLLIPSLCKLTVAVGRLRFLPMTFSPVLLHVLGRRPFSLMLWLVRVPFGLLMASPLRLPFPCLLLFVTLLIFLMLEWPLSALLSLRSTKRWSDYTLQSGLTCLLISRLMRGAAEPLFLWRVSIAPITLQPLLT